MKGKRYEGFSLIEILVVVALIIILAAITIIAINPAKNFRDTRNAQRASDVNAILNAVTQYTSDGGTLSDLGDIAKCKDENDIDQSTKIGTEAEEGYVNLAAKFVGTEGNAVDLLVAIPKDPSNGTDEDTGYTICETEGGRVQIAAPRTEGKAPIVVKR